MVGEFDFLGTIDAIQPWVSMHRSFDQRQEEYLGYLLRIRMRDGATTTLGLDESQQEQTGLQVGDLVEGAASGSRALRVKVLARSKERRRKGPPWLGVPGPLDLYEERGFRRLDERSFRGACRTCVWACEMEVELTIDHWNPSDVDWRTETFCYGPLSCRKYRAGPTRFVPGRKGLVYEEEDWVDQDATSHREDDE